jgi:hypothetical protein
LRSGLAQAGLWLSADFSLQRAVDAASRWAAIQCGPKLTACPRPANSKAMHASSTAVTPVDKVPPESSAAARIKLDRFSNGGASQASLTVVAEIRIQCHSSCGIKPASLARNPAQNRLHQ